MAAAERAAELDQVDAFSSLPDAVAAFQAVEEDGDIPAGAVTGLREAVGPGPLAGLVEQLFPS